MQGQPPTARPRPRPPVRGRQPPARAAPAGRSASRRHNRLSCGARKGLPPTTNPTANKGGAAGRSGGRPLAGRLPVGKGNRRLHRGNDDGGDVEGAKGVRKGKGKGRLGKAKVAKKDPAKDKGQCFHYSQDGLWKRNYKDYLADKAK
ncbi:hypothetical protein BHM03_00023131 [Ensete ventricosum]|nr:hypothetical protein BHM03_00023131 [Ensete ventricosum]